MPRITILQAGFYDSIQDKGRKKHRHLGVPCSGAMDQKAADLANSILNNTLDAAVLELVLSGGTYLFSTPTCIAITGAKAKVTVNDRAVEQNKLLDIKSGEVLKIGVATTGNFMYVAIGGGFQTEEVLGSKSFYTGITLMGNLQKGHDIDYAPYTDRQFTKANWKPVGQESALRCYAGAEFNLLDRKQQEKLLNTSFTISKNWNRMAFQLEEKIYNSLEQLKSSPVLPGTVQLTANGQLIVLMRDAPTTGGYPRVLQLDETSISSVAQKRVGSQVDFIVL
ncbi:biotin-dependent carboxyltransferase family protein [Nonlabens sp.]|uniref:5-oxoprolinase subunit C family protein n=1 Tax=Nonlabens sp. TaxID=1888209 RepID=UPI0025D7B375|nr:biotin-dependent carboxyltransferase family protein [Nonlabens sp.]